MNISHGQVMKNLKSSMNLPQITLWLEASHLPIWPKSLLCKEGVGTWWSSRHFLVQPSILLFCAPLFSKEDSVGWTCVRDKRRDIILHFTCPSQLHQFLKGHRVMAVIHSNNNGHHSMFCTIIMNTIMFTKWWLKRERLCCRNKWETFQ